MRDCVAGCEPPRSCGRPRGPWTTGAPAAALCTCRSPANSTSQKRSMGTTNRTTHQELGYSVTIAAE
jgi:hypothetical protein